MGFVLQGMGGRANKQLALTCNLLERTLPLINVAIICSQIKQLTLQVA